MSTSIYETAMAKLQALIQSACAALMPEPSVGEINENIAVAIEVAISDPAYTRIVLADGDSEEPDVLFGADPVYDHRKHPVIEMVAVHLDEVRRRPALDVAINAIVAAIAADQTLGGVVDLVRAETAVFGTITDVGAPPGRTAQLPLVVLYSSDNPVG